MTPSGGSGVTFLIHILGETWIFRGDFPGSFPLSMNWADAPAQSHPAARIDWFFPILGHFLSPTKADGWQIAPSDLTKRRHLLFQSFPEFGKIFLSSDKAQTLLLHAADPTQKMLIFGPLPGQSCHLMNFKIQLATCSCFLACLGDFSTLSLWIHESLGVLGHFSPFRADYEGRNNSHWKENNPNYSYCFIGQIKI